MNHLIIGALEQFHSYCGPSFTVEYPTGSGRCANLLQVARDLARRLAGIFRDGPDGRQPVHGGATRFHEDPRLAQSDPVP